MENKLIKKITLLFLTLTVGFFLQNYWQNKKFAPNTKNYQKTVEKLPLEKINLIKLDNQEKTHWTIEKKDNIWQINNQEANKEKIEGFLKTILNETNTELVAQTNARHQELNLSENKAQKITLQTNLDRLELLVGKDDPQGYYIRFKNQDTTYLLGGLTPSHLATSSSSWYQPTPTPTAYTKTPTPTL